MSRELQRRDVIDALTRSEDGVPRCREALLADSRESFMAADSPVHLLPENLEIKYRIAKERGKTLEGDLDLLLTLVGLGSKQVTGVFLDQPGEHIALFLRSSTLEPLGCVVVTEN